MLKKWIRKKWFCTRAMPGLLCATVVGAAVRLAAPEVP